MSLIFRSFQNFEDEVVNLPSKYVPNKGGGLWLAVESHVPVTPATVVGCIALRSLDLDSRYYTTGDDCEELSIDTSATPLMKYTNEDKKYDGSITSDSNSVIKYAEVKRLTIRPEHRSKGFGTTLCRFIIQKAKEMGYKILYLDTLTRLPGTVKLYDKLGFDRVKQYCENPESDAVFFMMNL